MSLETLAVEVEFVAPLIDPETCLESDEWILRGKIDAIARDTDTGETLLVEHKTASSDISPGSDYWRRLRLDSQISLYFDGAKALGYDPVGIIYDVVAKPNLRLGGITKKRSEPESLDEFRARYAATIAESPNTIFARSHLVRFDAELDQARSDVWNVASQLAAAIERDQYPRNPNACWRYGSMCEWFAVCSGEAVLGESPLYRQSVAHSELSAGDESETRPALTNSRMSLARECQRAHKYRYLDLWETTTAKPALAFGSLVHLGLEHWWLGSGDERLDDAIEAMRASDTVDPLDLVKAEELLRGYHYRWSANHITAARAA